MRADHVAGTFFVGVGLSVIALSGDLPFGQLSMPGAGFLPVLVAGLIILLAASLFVRANESPSFTEIKWDDARHALQVIAITGVAVSFYIYLGYIITMFAMMLALLVMIERKNILRAAAYSAGVAVVTYIVFVRVLQSPLPPGILGYW
ncbi:MAG: tripartite tricarboxylate transporter TctB family protein [Pseudolabrys sp.]|nr:tripartite tricarboxylate transporter TctB family protein [Pseudolabrys sp.]